MAKRKKNIAACLPERPSARFIIRLFAEGETEVVYLQKIAALHSVRINKELVDSSPIHLLTKAIKWTVEHAKILREDHGKNRIWVVFDDDAKARDMEEVVRIWKICPEECMKTCKIRDRNRCDFNDVLSRVNIGFMTPCIEIWALMCLDKRVCNYSLDRHKLQSELHHKMPSYKHDGHPYFDVDKMVEWRKACAQADDWRRTYGDFPNCMHAARYAGIAPLVREIMEE